MTVMVGTTADAFVMVEDAEDMIADESTILLVVMTMRWCSKLTSERGEDEVERDNEVRSEKSFEYMKATTHEIQVRVLAKGRSVLLGGMMTTGCNRSRDQSKEG